MSNPNQQNPTTRPSPTELIDQLIAQEATEDIFRLVHQRKRKKIHDAAKVNQPPDLRWPNIKAELFKPPTIEDQQQSNVDYLVQIIDDCLLADNEIDTIYALVRMYRKIRAMQPHLPPLENPSEVSTGPGSPPKV